MDIRQFSPQTQRTLSRMDFNRDDKLSARELEWLKNIPSSPTIDQKDLALIQAELKKAKGPEQIIVSLVDDANPPLGYKKPEPLFQEAKAKPSADTAAKPLKSAEKPKKPVTPAAPVELNLKASPKAAKKNTPEADAPGMDVQATSKVGPLQLQGTSGFSGEGQHTGSKLTASIDTGSNLSMRMGVATVDSTSSKTTSKPATGKSTKATTPKSPAAAQQVQLDGQVQAGALKLSGQGKLNLDSSQISDLGTTAEYQVIKGHSLKAEAKPVVDDPKKLSWGTVKLGTSHEVVSGLSLTTSAQLDADGKATKYGGGFKYDYGNGLSFDGEANTRSDTNFSSPALAARSMDFRAGFRFKREF